MDGDERRKRVWSVKNSKYDASEKSLFRSSPKKKSFNSRRQQQIKCPPVNFAGVKIVDDFELEMRQPPEIHRHSNAKVYKLSKEKIDAETDKVKLNRQNLFNKDDLQIIIEERGLHENSPHLEPAKIDKNTKLTAELLAQLQVEQVAHEITKYVLHIKSLVRECKVLNNNDILKKSSKDYCRKEELKVLRCIRAFQLQFHTSDDLFIVALIYLKRLFLGLKQKMGSLHLIKIL